MTPSLTTSQHSQRLHVGFQNGLLFGALVGVLLAQPHDGTQRLDVEAVALGFGIDVADVVGDRLLFFFKPFDALDDGLELVFGELGRGLVLDGGGRGGHRVLLSGTEVEAKSGSAARFITHRIPKRPSREARSPSRRHHAHPQRARRTRTPRGLYTPRYSAQQRR